MLNIDKITEIFCITDDFCQKFDIEVAKHPKLSVENATKHRNPAIYNLSDYLTF